MCKCVCLCARSCDCMCKSMCDCGGHRIISGAMPQEPSPCLLRQALSWPASLRGLLGWPSSVLGLQACAQPAFYLVGIELRSSSLQGSLSCRTISQPDAVRELKETEPCCAALGANTLASGCQVLECENVGGNQPKACVSHHLLLCADYLMASNCEVQP